jgi:hypothetical protein
MAEPRITLMVIPPLPGERRKSSSLVLLLRGWRSKWWRVACMGPAKRCMGNDCIHVQHVCHRYARCVRDPETRG